MQVILTLLVLLCLALPTLAAPPHYRVTDIGPAFDRFGERVSVNNKGQVTGTSLVSDAGHHVSGNIPTCAFLWQHGRRTLISPTSGFSATYVGAINDSGQIAGTLNDTTDGATLVIDNHAFLWESGKMQDLGDDAPFAVTTGEAINNQGEIVGSAKGSARPVEDDDRLTEPHAFLYSHGAIRDLGQGAAYGINDKGQIAGEIEFEATLWQNGQAQDLGISGRAVAINNQGSILIRKNDRTPVSVSYLWENGASHPLLLFSKTSHCTAKAINDRGQIVGGSQVRDFQGLCALLWQGGRVYDLNKFIPAKLGWTLDGATGINNKGQIVGYGTFHGQDHAFLLTPR